MGAPTLGSWLLAVPVNVHFTVLQMTRQAQNRNWEVLRSLRWCIITPRATGVSTFSGYMPYCIDPLRFCWGCQLSRGHISAKSAMFDSSRAHRSFSLSQSLWQTLPNATQRIDLESQFWELAASCFCSHTSLHREKRSFQDTLPGRALLHSADRSVASFPRLCSSSWLLWNASGAPSSSEDSGSHLLSLGPFLTSLGGSFSSLISPNHLALFGCSYSLYCIRRCRAPSPTTGSS